MQIDQPVEVLALIGLAFLLFLAGLEIDVHRLRGQSLGLALIGFAVSFVLAAGVGFALACFGLTRAPLLVAIVLCATSLGLVVPVREDAGQIMNQAGQLVIAAAALFGSAAAVVQVPLFVVALILVRGLPALLHRRSTGTHRHWRPHSCRPRPCRSPPQRWPSDRSSGCSLRRPAPPWSPPGSPPRPWRYCAAHERPQPRPRSRTPRRRGGRNGRGHRRVGSVSPAHGGGPHEGLDGQEGAGHGWKLGNRPGDRRATR
ncbi:cation:proton antiporter [Pseudonocardia yuanmonensis]|uniref:cation:proton antiporter domain-containing protein n=1 Tax=Pseudonocardia yuanmonensis TaxID=1095914 RepID=UPI0031E7700B